MNATLPHAPRALAAAVAAFALALVIALVAPAAIGTVQDRLGDRSVPALTASPTVVTPPPTWARTPLASPLTGLRQVPR